MKKDRDIGISAGDCGEPREIEYANEEEWPPNSRQVLYYFSAMGSHFGFASVGPVEAEGGKERERGKAARKRISSVKRREISSRNRRRNVAR
jgi:hypothetical protein